MVNGSVISDIVNDTSKLKTEVSSKVDQKAVTKPKPTLKKEENPGSNLLVVAIISILVLVILIGISIISYLKTK